MTEQPSVVDQMAEDAVPTEYPPGTPELIPILHVRPRSRRAEVKRQFKKFQAAQQKLDVAKAAGVFDDLDEDADDKAVSPELHAARIDASADLDEMLQLMDDVMRMCAADPDAYQRWSIEVEDDTLSAAFAVFVDRSQPGEASSSTS